MLPDLLFYGGIALCGAAAVGAIIAIVALRFSKARLDKKLDELYGQRRR